MINQSELQFVDTDLVAELVELAWQSLFATDLIRLEPDGLGQHDDIICASVSVGGPWSATLLVVCSAPLARSCTAGVLGMNPAELDDADIDDLMGELANIIGGNLKGIVSEGEGDWSLSLPVVSHGSQTVPGSRQTTEVRFESNGLRIECHVLEHA